MAIDERREGEDYADVFQHLIGANIRYVTEQIERSGAVPQLSLRSQALHTLRYAFEYDSAAVSWPALELMTSVAPKMEQAGLRNEWIPFLKNGIRISESLGADAERAALCYQLGWIYQLCAEYEEALRHLRESAQLYADLGDDGNSAHVLSRIAYVLRLQRNFEEAVETVERALALYHPDDPRQEFTHFVLGAVALDEGEAASAAEHFERSLGYCERLGDKRLIAQRSGNLGVAFFSQKDFDAAIVHYNKAINLSEELQDPVHQALMSMNLGNVHVETREFTCAYDLFTAAEPILRQAGDELHLSMLYYNWGWVCNKMKRWEDAEEYLTRAVERWKYLGNVRSQVNALDTLGEVYLDSGQLNKASESFNEALILLQSIRNSPGYDRLHKLVSEHIDVTRFRIEQV